MHTSLELNERAPAGEQREWYELAHQHGHDEAGQGGGAREFDSASRLTQERYSGSNGERPADDTQSATGQGDFLVVADTLDHQFLQSTGRTQRAKKDGQDRDKHFLPHQRRRARSRTCSGKLRQPPNAPLQPRRLRIAPAAVASSG
jgi:hypothetical protein